MQISGSIDADADAVDAQQMRAWTTLKQLQQGRCKTVGQSKSVSDLSVELVAKKDEYCLLHTMGRTVANCLKSNLIEKGSANLTRLHDSHDRLVMVPKGLIVLHLVMLRGSL